MLVATTVGAGLFILPWIFHNAGWWRAALWLAALSALVVFAEHAYWKTLEAVDERERMVALAHNHLGREWGTLALIGVLGGMLFILMIYLALAERFLGILLPFGGRTGLFVFWALAVLPATFNIRRFAFVEGIGSLLKGLLIVAVFFSAARYGAIFESTEPLLANPLLPFGAILFSLSGWTAIEPMYEFWRARRSRAGGKRPGKADSGVRPRPPVVIAGGMAAIAALYFLFSAGILGSIGDGSFVSADTLSGLVGWPFWKVGALAALGLFALWTAYGPTSLELENALSKDLHWKPVLAFAVVALVPLFLVLSGFVNIIRAVTFAGGLFVGLQYMTIFALAERVWRPRRAVVWSMRLGALIFALAALYEIYSFVVG
jgi:amino acid permease